jgi:peptidoglycan/LPS O-acetylase OafA/YrhL
MSDDTTPPRSAFAHRPGLDGLRAIAVVVVVAFHAGALDGGWIGVDVFFVLSGWLITGLMIAEVSDTGGFDVTAFWRRRFRRLLPALVVTLAFVTVLAVTGALDLRRRGVIGALTYTTNWLNITSADGYWDSFAAPDPLRHLWSLAVEEQIYLIWPLVMVVVLRVVRSHRRTIAVRSTAAIVATASVGVALFGASAGWSLDRLYQGTDTRASAFAIGALTAGLTMPALGNRVRHLVVVVALAVALMVGMDGGSTSLFGGSIHLITLCGVIAVTTAAGIERGPLCWSAMRRVGVWSYGIYLVHYPLTVALNDHLTGVWLAFVVFALSVPLAALSHRLVEQPIRHHGLSGRRLTTGLLAASAIAVVAVAVAVPIAPRGLDRLPALATPEDAAGADDQDRPTATSAPRRRVLIVGDSVPALAADELAAVAEEQGATLGVVARPACVGSPYPDDQFLEANCTVFIDSLRSMIAAQRPDVVVWWWGGVGAEQLWAGNPIDVCSLAGFAAADDQINWQVEISGSARPVVVVPPARTDIGERGGEAGICQGLALVDAAQRRDVDTIRLDMFICPDVRTDCDRVPRDDGMHIDGDGATTVARWLFARRELWG